VWAAIVALAGSRGARAAVVSLGVLAPAELALPALVPLGQRGSGSLRLLLAIHCVLSLLKACELHVSRRRNGYPPWFSAWLWLLWVRPHNHVYSRRGKGELRPPARCLRGLAVGALCLVVGLPLLVQAFDADLGRYGFWTDHLAKLAAFYVVLTGVSRVLANGEHLLGSPAQPLLRDPVLAYSPADFWQRWNTPINHLFFALVFRRWGRRSPYGALFGVFLLSAVMHEYNTGIASLHVRGYQVLFFLLHGVAAGLTWRWRPRGAAKGVGRALTLTFGLATSAIFFASAVPVFDDLVTFYPHGELLPP